MFRGSSAESVRATLLKGGEQIIPDPVGERSAVVSKLGHFCSSLLLKYVAVSGQEPPWSKMAWSNISTHWQWVEELFSSIEFIIIKK